MTLSPFQVVRSARGWLASVTREAVTVLTRPTQAGLPMSFKAGLPMSFKDRVVILRARAAQLSAAQLGAMACAMEETAQVRWNDWKNQ